MMTVALVKNMKSSLEEWWPVSRIVMFLKLVANLQMCKWAPFLLFFLSHSCYN